MSAIWGAVNLAGNAIGEEEKKCMKAAFAHCRIDRYEEVCDNHIYLGCGIQHFVPQARQEQLPYTKDGIFYTADVVLDNRKELCGKLGIADEADSIPDGELLFQMYRRYGRECLNDLLGAYAFVWYDQNRNTLEIAADAVGNRLVYYRKRGDTVYFSSLIEPLRLVAPDVELNDRWMLDFLAMDYLSMHSETQENPLQDIYRTAPAQYIRITAKDITKQIYWQPFADFKVYKYRTDEQYRKEFRQLWTQAVKEVMRSDDKTAIMLSGGLDSTAVAAIAAPYLKEQGKKLYSFTSVPMEGYSYDNTGWYMENEKEDVEKTAQFYGNIEPAYLDLEGRTPWKLIDEEETVLEIPFKSIQNCLWLTQGMEQAYQKGARLMLTGSYGNTSVSFSDLDVYMNTLFRQHRYARLVKEVRAFSANMGFSARYALWEIIKNNLTGYRRQSSPYGSSYVNEALAEQKGCGKRLEKMNEENFHAVRDYEKYRHLLVHFLALRQIGESYMKMSLATGVLERDPTRDKRIIEFCIHLPIEQFSRDGMDRRLVKVYLKDIMPPHVFHFHKRGKQSADLVYRMGREWETIRKEWIRLYEEYGHSRYVDTKSAKEDLLNKKNIESYTAFELTRHMYTLLVLRYENRIKKQINQSNKLSIERNEDYEKNMDECRG